MRLSIGQMARLNHLTIQTLRLYDKLNLLKPAYVDADSGYRYYTGVIFKAYTYETGEYIATGGRYDGLLPQFGKDSPAIGFAIVLDRLMDALSRQNIPVEIKEANTILLYEEEARKNAL